MRPRRHRICISRRPRKGQARRVCRKYLSYSFAGPLVAANLTDAALFRALGDERRTRTLLLDEVDAIFRKRNEKEDLRALLNAGTRRRVPALRMVGEGSNGRDRADR